MDQQQLIADMEARASKLGISVATLCSEAGVHPTTFSRWKRSEKNPAPIGATLTSLNKLGAVLSEAERKALIDRRKVTAV